MTIRIYFWGRLLAHSVAPICTAHVCNVPLPQFQVRQDGHLLAAGEVSGSIVGTPANAFCGDNDARPSKERINEPLQLAARSVGILTGGVGYRHYGEGGPWSRGTNLHFLSTNTGFIAKDFSLESAIPAPP